MLLDGSILIAVLTLIVDALLGMVDKNVNNGKNKSSKNKKITIVLVFFVAIGFFVNSFSNSKKVINVASKPTTETYILVEITALLRENNTDLFVKITHGVGGGTSNIHPSKLNYILIQTIGK